MFSMFTLLFPPLHARKSQFLIFRIYIFRSILSYSLPDTSAKMYQPKSIYINLIFGMYFLTKYLYQ